MLFAGYSEAEDEVCTEYESGIGVGLAATVQDVSVYVPESEPSEHVRNWLTHWLP